MLPSVLKIIARVILDQTKTFVLDKDILLNYQSSFWGNHSTNLCLSFLTDKFSKGFDDGLLTWMILIDLYKQFDKIHHEILLQELKAIRFSESTLKWFKLFLSERIFFKNIEKKILERGHRGPFKDPCCF